MPAIHTCNCHCKSPLCDPKADTGIFKANSLFRIVTDIRSTGLTADKYTYTMVFQQGTQVTGR